MLRLLPTLGGPHWGGRGMRWLSTTGGLRRHAAAERPGGASPV